MKLTRKTTETIQLYQPYQWRSHKELELEGGPVVTTPRWGMTYDEAVVFNDTLSEMLTEIDVQKCGLFNSQWFLEVEGTGIHAFCKWEGEGKVDIS